MSVVSDEKLQKALVYLAETDTPCAEAKALYEGLKDQLKTIQAVAFQDASGSVESRKADSYASIAYQNHVRKIQDALFEYEAMRNKRLTAGMIVEVWRSENANRRVGNV